MEDTTSAVADSSATTDTLPGVTSAEPSAAASSPRPSSMREALEQTAAKASAANRDAATIVPPAVADVPVKTPGPIPFDTHKTALENARLKATEEATGKWKDYEWVQQVPANDLRAFAERAIRSKGDPIAFLTEMAEEIAADPVHGQALRSLAARQLAAGRGQAQARPEQEPQPDVEIVDEHGRVTGHTYSATQRAALRAFEKRQDMAEFNQLIAPLVQSHEKAVNAEKIAEAKSSAAEWSGGFSKEVAQYHGFTEHKQDIGRDVLAQLQRLAPNDPRGNDPAFLEAATLRAYHTVVGPKLPALIQAQHLASLKQKAVAQTENPSRSATPPASRPRNPAELAKFMAQRAAERRG